jgi:hypothetical protein
MRRRCPWRRLDSAALQMTVYCARQGATDVPYTPVVTEPTRSITAHRFASNQEADRHDAEYWRGASRRLSASSWPGVCPSNNGNSSVGKLRNPDFVDLLRAFIDADVRFLIVGAYALAHHRRARATGDLDIWVQPTPENAPRVLRALRQRVPGQVGLCRIGPSTESNTHH